MIKLGQISKILRQTTISLSLPYIFANTFQNIGINDGMHYLVVHLNTISRVNNNCQ